MFILMGVGMLVKRYRLLGAEEVRHLNHMVFVVFFPVMMFRNLYGSDIKEALDGKLIAFGVAAVLIEYLITLLVVLRVEIAEEQRRDDTGHLSEQFCHHGNSHRCEHVWTRKPGGDSDDGVRHRSHI